MLKRIRRIWNSNVAHPAKKLWEWAKAPAGPLLRAKRFGRLAVWARKKREQAKERGDEEERRLWEARRKAYHGRSVYYQKKYEEKKKRGKIGKGPPGPPRWSGSKSIVHREVLPVYRRHGVPVTSLKRSWAPGSDHWFGSLTAYAADGGTFNGAGTAHAVADALGISGYSTGNYASYYISRGGNRFRVQILWAVSGHFNHVHVGIRRA